MKAKHYRYGKEGIKRLDEKDLPEIRDVIRRPDLEGLDIEKDDGALEKISQEKKIPAYIACQAGKVFQLKTGEVPWSDIKKKFIDGPGTLSPSEQGLLGSMVDDYVVRNPEGLNPGRLDTLSQIKKSKTWYEIAAKIRDSKRQTLKSKSDLDRALLGQDIRSMLSEKILEPQESTVGGRELSRELARVVDTVDWEEDSGLLVRDDLLKRMREGSGLSVDITAESDKTDRFNRYFSRDEGDLNRIMALNNMLYLQGGGRLQQYGMHMHSIVSYEGRTTIAPKDVLDICGRRPFTVFCFLEQGRLLDFKKVEGTIKGREQTVEKGAYDVETPPGCPPIGKVLENIDRAGSWWKDNIEFHLDPKDVLNWYNVSLATGNNLLDQQVTIGLDETGRKLSVKRKEG
jgi:hypothetical protein